MKKYAFTLAEVLITLSILGVVAVISVSSIYRNVQDSIMVTKVKQVYSLLDNVVNQMIVENGQVQTWNWPDKADFNQINNANYLASLAKNYFNVSQDCDNNKKGDCSTYGYKSLQGETINNSASYKSNYYNNAFVLRNGMVINCLSGYLLPEHSSESYQAITFRVDINGIKEPNRSGWDIFDFYFTNSGRLITNFDSTTCNPRLPSNTRMNAMGCSTWILRHGNLKYKYQDVTEEW